MKLVEKPVLKTVFLDPPAFRNISLMEHFAVLHWCSRLWWFDSDYEHPWDGSMSPVGIQLGIGESESGDEKTTVADDSEND